MYRLITPLIGSGALMTVSMSPVLAQPVPTSSSPSPYFSAPQQHAPTNALPKGRAQTQGQAPLQRRPVYASARPGLGNRQAAPTRPYPGATPAASVPKPMPGGRIEARLGWDRLMASATDVDNDIDGALYGFGVGYDKSFGKYFVGAFAGIDATSGSVENVSSIDVVNGITTNTFRETVEQTFQRDLELGIRAGYRFSKYLAAYGSVAFVNLKSEVSTETVTIEDNDNTDNVPGTESTPVRSGAEQFQDGWRFGVGSEIEIVEGVFAKAEYRYSDYGEDELGLDVTRHQMVTGVGLRF